MKYEEIIELDSYFQPVYDIENETKTYWKQFIPNEKFYKVLSATINSFESGKPEERKSIWLQGSYGTGKSHATAVVKHLLSDDLSEINDFIEKLEEQLKYKVKNFRKNKRVFPVVLKGVSLISNNRNFAWVIQRAVKEALRKAEIKLNIKSDFETVIEILQSGDIDIKWENLFSGTMLEVYGTKEDIIWGLQQGDVSILDEIETVLSQKLLLHFSTKDIARWLVEVRDELKSNGIADYLGIYWDEYTGVLELPKSNLLTTQLESIAELSAANKGVYLFVVAHRTPSQTNITVDDVKKFLERFHVLDYSMEPITTYHIIQSAIKKKDKNKFKAIKDKYIGPVISLIKEITRNEGLQVQKCIEDLFPIHPYTAYLATFIARNMGSTERSMFEFLYGKATVEPSFKKFIKENPGENENVFLTADYLWDFFYGEFERMGKERVHAVLEKYKLYKDELRKKGKEYLSAFKGVLLLNLLYSFVTEEEGASLLTPSEKNIINLFAGAINEKVLTEFLSYIDDKQIINKTPGDLFLIRSSALPPREVEDEKENIKRVYDNDRYNKIDQILNKEQKKELEDTIGASVNREVELMLMMVDNDSKEYLIKNKVEKAFKRDYTIHVCLFLGRSEQELQQIRSIIKNISIEFGNIIFAISEAILDDKTFNSLIDYRARAIVASRHNYSEERNVNDEDAVKIVDNWLNQVKSGYIEWFLKKQNGKVLMRDFSIKINEELSREIFPCGLENIQGAINNKNIWTYKKAKTSAEVFLFANDRGDLEIRTSKGLEKYLREILKDNDKEYIVDANLEIKNYVGDHPLEKIGLEVKRALAKERDRGEFNLGDALSFLSKPPYGFYPSMVHMAAAGFLMRPYIGKLFDAGTGAPIQKEVMREKVLALFDYWEKRNNIVKLEVRFGTAEEKKLVEILKEMFKFEEDVRSLTEAKWRVREWSKIAGFPIWAFKFADNVRKNTAKAIDSIFEIVKSIDKELTYEKVRDYLNAIEDVQYDLDMLIKPDHLKGLFEKWLKSIEGVEISTEELEEVVGYIKENMQGEVAFWTEEKVREKVKDWYAEKLKQRIEELNQTESKITNGSNEIAQDYQTSVYNPIPDPFYSERKETIENIKMRIKCSSEEDVKEILIRLIDELKEERVCKYIGKYLGVL